MATIGQNISLFIVGAWDMPKVNLFVQRFGKIDYLGSLVHRSRFLSSVPFPACYPF